MSAKPLILVGTIKEIMPVEAGNLKDGTAYTKQAFIIETDEKYPKEVFIIVWNSVIEQLSRVKVKEDVVNVYFNVKSRNYVTKEGELVYSTDVTGWKIEVDFKASKEKEYISRA